MATGIFQKPCPACATLLPRDAVDCDCGYLFDSDEAADESQQLAQEELFETYLTARLEQALADLDAARAALSAAPSNTNQAYAVLKRVQVLQQQRHELTVQQEKVALLRERMGSVPAEFRAAQASRAAQILATTATTCERCGTSMPDTGATCACAAASLLQAPPTANGDLKPIE